MVILRWVKWGWFGEGGARVFNIIQLRGRMEIKDFMGVQEEINGMQEVAALSPTLAITEAHWLHEMWFLGPTSFNTNYFPGQLYNTFVMGQSCYQFVYTEIS